MKKLLLVLVFTITANIGMSQEETQTFPYGKMLKMTSEELLNANFKYDKNKNRYVLTKQNGLNAASSILGALSGIPINYVPHVNDYSVVIQRSENGVSYIQVTFYDSNVYDQVYDFATTYGENLKTTGIGNQAFSY